MINLTIQYQTSTGLFVPDLLTTKEQTLIQKTVWMEILIFTSLGGLATFQHLAISEINVQLSKMSSHSSFQLSQVTDH